MKKIKWSRLISVFLVFVMGVCLLAGCGEKSEAKEDAKTIPIIAMTANAFREDAERCMEAGMNAHLAKPLDIEKIRQTICEQLRNK